MRPSFVRPLLATASALSVVAVVAGCSSSSTAPRAAEAGSTEVTASGTVGGKTFTVGSAIANSGGSAAAKTGPMIAIAVASGSEFDMTCAEYISSGNSNTELANVTAFYFEVVNGGDALKTGTYNVLPSGSVRVIAGTILTDASCTNTGEKATAGSVTINSLSATSVSGSYDLTFARLPSGTDRMTGTFDAPLCAVPASFFETTPSDGGLICQS